MTTLAELDRATLLLAVAALTAATLLGVAAAATTPLVPAGALLALALVGLILWRPMAGLALFIAVIALLPFGVIPVPLAGAQLTFVDFTLLTTFASVLLRLPFGRLRMPLDLPSLALLGFVVLAIAAFVGGAVSWPTPPELVRRFGKLLVSLLLFVVVRGVVADAGRLECLARWLMVAGAVQGAIGALLMALSPIIQLNLLTRLVAIGYPSTDVLRYVPGANDTYTTQLRAIGTSVDPNVFGGTLMLALVLQLVQLVSPRPILPRALLALLVVPTAAGVALSLSRASWLGLAVGLLLIGCLRYRRILALGALAGLLVLVSPPGQALVARFVGGLSTADPATAFRVGEFGNALTLMQRYPLLGIGFGVSPDIDVTAGVSSVYLLMGEQTGLLGLLAYCAALASVWLVGLRGLRTMRDARLQGVRAAFLAAVSGALVTGLLDHYFANYLFPHAVALFWVYAAGLVVAAQAPSSARDRQREPERAAQPRPAALHPHLAAVQQHQVPRN